MNILDELNILLNGLINRKINPKLDINTCMRITNLAINYINMPKWSEEDNKCADIILRISNLLYNNTSLDVLPLDDGIYDQLISKYKKLNPYNYQVGAIPVNYNEIPQNEFDNNNGLKLMATCLNKSEMDSKLYVGDILSQYTPNDPRLITMASLIRDPISKRLVTATHNYPELVGTLDKCKFVLNHEAIEKQLFDSPSVDIFERDFIHQHLKMGIITPDEIFRMVGELKYDGISVEATVLGDTIINAFSRGDTAENLATDLTPILGGYKFPNAKSVPKDKPFGIKFEAIITKFDLQRMAALRNKSYKNCRNAIIGLFGSSDAFHFRDFITLIPLSTSLDIDRIDEIKFLNKYYSSGQYNRYSVFEGNYQQILFQVKQFTESAEIARKILPYLIDGVVISYIDKLKITELGRENSVNKYSIAIKFNPKTNRTIFLGYSYNVGKTGDITPMAHFKPCEFIGTIHDKQTIHSYKRFKELGLRKGDEIDVEYRNEVICYVTKPDTENNRNNQNSLEEFIKVCPSCGEPLIISDSEKSIRCPNYDCPEQRIMRMTDMINQLGFKDFSEETIRAIDLKSFSQLINIYPDDCAVLGPTNQSKFMQYVDNLRYTPINDFKILASLGFDNIGVETWKIILHEYSIRELVLMDSETLINNLININSIGLKTAETICNMLQLNKQDIDCILMMSNIIESKGLESGEKVAISGFRNPEFIEILNKNGYDASDSYGVSKKISYLIVADKNSNSSKIQKAVKFGIPIMTMQEFIDAKNIMI